VLSGELLANSVITQRVTTSLDILGSWVRPAGRLTIQRACRPASLLPHRGSCVTRAAIYLVTRGPRMSDKDKTAAEARKAKQTANPAVVMWHETSPARHWR
jgi:hypothetical protein